MASVGVTTYLSNLWLNWLRGSNASPPSKVYAQLFVGSPGANGTANKAAGNTTRMETTFAAASGGAITTTGTVPSWVNTTASNSETLSHVAFFDASTGGNCLWTAQLSSARQWSTNDTYTLSTDALNFAPLASD